MHNFTDLNLGYISTLYERYLKNPSSVDPEIQDLFRTWTPEKVARNDGKGYSSVVDYAQIVNIANLAQAIRSYGHLAAHLDPLGNPLPGDPSLLPATYQVDELDLARLPSSLIGGYGNAADALDAIRNLTQVYTSSIGYDYAHIRVPEEREWLRQCAEKGSFRPPVMPVDFTAVLEQLTTVEVFEQFLQRFFPGKTRFSIEGVDMLVPMLDDIIAEAEGAGICMMTIGMGHRGRLNVLAHVLAKPYAQIMAEFKDPGNDYTAIHGTSWTGDVKYHKGANRTVVGEEEIKAIVVLPPNPSHLELINPILSGMARAAQSVVDKPGTPKLFPLACLPIQIHGDASFPGEGIVAESLNLSRLPGYQTSGTIHIIVNNQLGYTTPPYQDRSTQYASDLAKGFEIPVMHVNADDTEACFEAARTAFAYRVKFHKDFLIDLVGYRRFGHNEGDEPSFTQPVLYEKIRNHPTVRKLLADQLVAQGLIDPDQPENWVKEDEQRLKNILDSLQPEKEDLVPSLEDLEKTNHRLTLDTHIDLESIQAINEALLTVPEGFTINRRLERSRNRWRNSLAKSDEPSIEWAQAETLALASILADGIAIRMTGQDVERGTFSQRHAVLHDAVTEETYVPLQNIPQARAAFEIHNSPLSESGALGFEYGYNLFDVRRMVIWEAQYGDFFNNAQAILDEFIAAGKAKWELKSSLVLLLPHGYEGAGPNHSSARPERFLQLAMNSNLRVANCTTASQYFHLLRIQAALQAQDPLPLVVFTPKSLLRHPRVASSPRELAEGSWTAVLDDSIPQKQRALVKRLVLCSGKIALDLADSSLRAEASHVAIVRLEQLCPFPSDSLQSIFDRYPKMEEIVWAQEEPENMGAWDYVHPRLAGTVNSHVPIRCVGRPASPSPSEGSLSWHMIVQKRLVEQVFLEEQKSHRTQSKPVQKASN